MPDHVYSRGLQPQSPLPGQSCRVYHEGWAVNRFSVMANPFVSRLPAWFSIMGALFFPSILSWASIPGV